jgi:hypothetical protein
MIKKLRLAVLVPALLCVGTVQARAQSQFPLVDKIAQHVVEKYQTSSCQQLASQRGCPPAGQKGEMEERAVLILYENADMRMEFINRVAAPVANKLFECGMIP